MKKEQIPALLSKLITETKTEKIKWIETSKVPLPLGAGVFKAYIADVAELRFYFYSTLEGYALLIYRNNSRESIVGEDDDSRLKLLSLSKTIERFSVTEIEHSVDAFLNDREDWQ